MTFLATADGTNELPPVLSLPADKMCDQISDAVLDAHLRQDPDCKVGLHYCI